MRHEQATRVARIEKADLAGLPPQWTPRERGQYLRGLLRQKGVDPDQLYQVEYHPRHSCWLLIQQTEPVDQPAAPAAVPPSQSDELFYVRVTDELRRTALAALGTRSVYFAHGAGRYELPEKAEEISPAELMNQLGGPCAGDPPVRFDAEGRWRAPRSEP
jgi:hypothetical protein